MCCSIPPAQGRGGMVSCFWLGAPGAAPRAAPSLSVGRMGCRQGRQRGRLAFLAPALGGSEWGRCMWAPMMPRPAHIGPHTSARGAVSHPQKWTQREGLHRRPRPVPWGGLALDTDTACDLRESLKDSGCFFTVMLFGHCVSLEKPRCHRPLPVARPRMSSQPQELAAADQPLSSQ